MCYVHYIKVHLFSVISGIPFACLAVYSKSHYFSSFFRLLDHNYSRRCCCWLFFTCSQPFILLTQRNIIVYFSFTDARQKVKWIYFLICKIYKIQRLFCCCCGCCSACAVQLVIFSLVVVFFSFPT